MDLWSVIRRWHHRDGLPIREITRRTGLSRNTIRKYLGLARMFHQLVRKIAQEFDWLRNFPRSEIHLVIPLTRKFPQPIKDSARAHYTGEISGLVGQVWMQINTPRFTDAPSRRAPLRSGV